MERTRRDLLAASAAIVAATGLSGCNASSDGEAGTTTAGTGTENETSTGGDDSGGSSTTGSGSGSGEDDGVSESSEPAATVDAAVAAEWNAMRARVFDALSLGMAGDAGAGASVVGNTFARFENAGGEYGAHEMLEATSQTSYENFEEALGELRSAGLSAENLDRAREEAGIADAELADAQRQLLDEPTANALEMQVIGANARNVGALAAAGEFEAAHAVGEEVRSRFEGSPAHEAIENADAEAYETFESALAAAIEAAGNESGGEARSRATEAFRAAIDGGYAIADAEAAAGAGHVAALQSWGWDAAALAGMGGPSTDFAHAVTLNVYRARAYDCHWLAARGETDRAATMAADVFAHFEGARAHEGLEEADHEAYEGFETALSELQSAIESGDSAGVDDAVARVDSNLVTGIEALAGPHAPILAAAFFRARFEDARALYRSGQNDVAAGVGESLFERFEADELGVHEAVESTSEDLYHAFEEEHLSGLIDAFENADAGGVETHFEGVQSTLLDYETSAASTAVVSGAEASYVAARGFDAAALDALGKDDRARSAARGAFEHFEAGAGGYHEALEEADHEIYETFEERIGAVASAAGNGEDVYPASKEFGAAAIDSAYAIVSSAGGSKSDAAAAVLGEAFAHFENARVHELLEEADRSAYHSFERQLDAFTSAIEDGGEVGAAAGRFAEAAQYAQFALVDAVEEFPTDLRVPGADGAGGGHGGEGSHGGGESDLQGGPNVVEGVPDDADHVIDMTAVAFEPAELTVSAGDKVVWTHAGGEAHSVTARQDGIPDGATYWASGDFDSEEAAVSGWGNGQGAVQSGHAYVHTFETTGTHEYYCIPHEAAGMTGSITVE